MRARLPDRRWLRPDRRWLLVAAAAAAMGVAGTYQFVWSSVRPALGTRLVASEAALGTVFTVYIVAQTLSQFPVGRFRDRHGPRLPLAVGAILLAAGYAGTALAESVEAVYVAYAVGGVGAGSLYTVAVNTPVKWFTGRRGLATGIVTMAYGGVSVLFIPAVRRGVATDFTATLLALAGVTGAVALVVTPLIRDPPTAETTAERATPDDGPAERSAPSATVDLPAGERAYGWREAVRTWQFWVLYAMFVVVNGVGLMLIGKAVAFAEGLGLPAAVATVAASVIALADSTGLLLVGGLSDRLGRERTVAATVTLSGLSLAAAVLAGDAGLGAVFVGCLAAAAFFRSPVFSVVPAMVGEYYGAARSSENYALLYTSKVWGGVVGGVLASLLIATVGWTTAFVAGAVGLVAVGLLAGVLRPVR